MRLNIVSERTGAIQKLRHELENSVDTNIDSINGLYEIVDVLIEQIQILQQDVNKLANIFIKKAEENKELVDKINNIPNKEIYI